MSLSLYSQNNKNMTNTTTITRVRNYQGSNTFVLKMKDVLNKWGNLTEKQAEAVQKCLSTEVKVDIETLSDDLKKVATYEGKNSFVLDVKSKLLTYGTLTDKQLSKSLEQITKEKDKEQTYHTNWPLEGETIKIGRRVGQQLKETYGLEFNPILLDITKVISVAPKAVKFSGKMTIKRGKVCHVCCKTLTDEFSMLTGVGKICAGHMKIPYITDASQAEKFRNDYLKRVEEIGEMEFWVPKSQIKKWSDDVTQNMVESMHW
jgi:hypothetical protein